MMDSVTEFLSNRFVVAVGVATSALAVGFYWGAKHAKKKPPSSRPVFGKSFDVTSDERQRQILDYVVRHTNEHPVLSELRQVTLQHSRRTMLCPSEESRLLAQLVRMIGGRKCIEIGTFTGYNTLSVALALPHDGVMIACDVSTEYTDIGKPFWEKAGVAHKIDLRIQPALDTLNGLIAAGEANTFDFVFIDADKVNMKNYYEKSLQLIRPGGVIALDNVLWDGAVVDDSKQDEDTVAIRAVADHVRDDRRVDSSFLCLADGLQLAVKL